MPIYLHPSNLIVRKSAVRKRYKGGLNQFRIDHNTTSENHNQEDRMLFSISRLNVDEFDIDFILDKGLQRATDFTIYSRLAGILWKSNWLEENAVFAWHRDEHSFLISKTEEVCEMNKIETLLNDHQVSSIIELLETLSFPPKPEPEKGFRLKYLFLISLVLFIVGGCIWWDVKFTLIITLVIVFHELGHFIAMRFFEYENVKMVMIPLIGGAVMGDKYNRSQKQEAVILLAGPLPGIILSVSIYLLSLNKSLTDIFTIPDLVLETMMYFFLINWLNLLPIYPLDGGRLLQLLFVKRRLLFTVLSYTGLLIGMLVSIVSDF